MGKSRKSGYESPPVSPGRRVSRKTANHGLKKQKAVDSGVQKAPGNVGSVLGFQFETLFLGEA